MFKGLFKSKLSFVVLLVIAFFKVDANTKDDFLKANFSVDFMSMHTWRGYATSYAPTIEPTLELSTGNSTSGIWAAHSIDNKYTEIDMYFTYNYKNISFTIFDYYCPPTYKASSEITNYDKYSTKHTIELALEVSNILKTPFNFMVATMVYGDDLHNETLKNRYSTYFQFAYSTEINKNNIDLVLGFNTFESYYSDQFGIVNAGISTSKSIKVFKTKEIPLQAALITNPSNNSLFIKFGFTL